MQAPLRADVVKSLKNGIVLNLLGMGAAILGMQATVGSLVAKALTTSAIPYYQGISPGQSPVLALDVFLVQVWCLLMLFFIQLVRPFGKIVLAIYCILFFILHVIHKFIIFYGPWSPSMDV